MRDLPTAEKTPTPENGARGSDCAESDFFIGRAYSIAKIYNIMYSRPRAACGSGFFCAFLQVFCYIYNFKSVFFCIFNSICRTSAALRQMCHADGTVIDKVSVFFCHTTVVIFFGSIYRLIRKLLDTLVFSAVIFVPEFCLVGAGRTRISLIFGYLSFNLITVCAATVSKQSAPPAPKKSLTVPFCFIPFIAGDLAREICRAAKNRK